MFINTGFFETTENKFLRKARSKLLFFELTHIPLPGSLQKTSGTAPPSGPTTNRTIDFVFIIEPVDIQRLSIIFVGFFFKHALSLVINKLLFFW